MADTGRRPGLGGKWEATSCNSWLWPYTIDDAQFESRRAIANMASGLRRSSEASLSGEPDVAEVLPYVAAANSILKATATALADVVAEAIARGATWKQVGEHLGISKTGAQNRFGKGIEQRRREILSLEGYAMQIAGPFLTDRFPKEVPRPLDETDWEAAPPVVAVPYAVRNLAGADIAIEEIFASGEFDLSKLHQTSERVRRSAIILLNPRATAALKEVVQQSDHSISWVDESPVIYFVRSGCLAFTAYLAFIKWATSENRTDDSTIRMFMLMRSYIHKAIMATFRPECIMLTNVMDERAKNSGNAVYAGKWPASVEPELSRTEVNEFASAYWRRDKDKLLEFGPDPDGPEYSIYDILEFIDDQDAE
jgi:hypothetical protein